MRSYWTALPFPVRIILLTLLYFLTAQIGLEFAFINRHVTLVWPPAGLALAALVLMGRRMWPAVFLGSLFANFSNQIPLPELLLLAAGNTLSALFAEYGLRKAGFQPALEQVRDVLLLFGVGVLASPVFAATFGVISLVLSGQALPADFPVLWSIWWLGDAMGVLVFAPLLLTLGGGNRPKEVGHQFESALMVIGTAVVAQLVFSRPAQDLSSFPLAYLTFPFVIWSALRFGPRGTSLVTALISVVAIWGTLRQSGPITAENVHEGLIFLWSYVAVAGGTSHLLAAGLLMQRRAEQALAKQRDFATQVMNALGQGVTVTNSQGRFEYVNSAYARLLNMDQEAIVGRTPEEFTSADYLDRLAAAVQERRRGLPGSYENRLICTDGSTVPVLVSATPRMVDRQMQGSIAVITDLTQIKQTEEALRESEAAGQRFQDRLKAIHQVSIELAKQPTFDDLCRRAIELAHERLGFDRIGMWFNDPNEKGYIIGSFGTDEQGNLQDERGFRHDHSGRFLEDFAWEDTYYVYVSDHGPIYNQRRQVIGEGWSAVALLSDGQQEIGFMSVDNLLNHRPPDRYQVELLSIYAATVGFLCGRKRAEAALHELTEELEQRVSERTVELAAANERLMELDRLKTKFVSDVTHELRTPLTAMNSHIYLLQHSKPEKHPEYIERLKLQIGRLTHFVNHVLDLSRLELGRERITFVPVNLNECIAQVMTALSPRAELAGLELRFEPQADLPPVLGDANQLSQVATNLIANAINYTFSGQVQVITRLDASAHKACFEVRDSGVGIHPHEIPKLFDRFYRGEFAGQSTIPGSGLGLSIVKEIVDLHEGQIDVESIVGQGTTFRVLFPLVSGGAPSSSLSSDSTAESVVQ